MERAKNAKEASRNRPVGNKIMFREKDNLRQATLNLKMGTKIWLPPRSVGWLRAWMYGSIQYVPRELKHFTTLTKWSCNPSKLRLCELGFSCPNNMKADCQKKWNITPIIRLLHFYGEMLLYMLIFLKHLKETFGCGNVIICNCTQWNIFALLINVQCCANNSYMTVPSIYCIVGKGQLCTNR